MNIGNFDLSGTKKFITHRISHIETNTCCGLKIENLKGDWQETGQVIGEKPSCKKCLKFLKSIDYEFYKPR